MLGVALGIGVLLALVGCTATEGCGKCQPPTENQERAWMGHRTLVTSPLLPVAPQDMVSQLLQRLEGSVNFEEAANPSVLLAMNLAGGDSDGPIHKWLLQEIKEEAVRRAQKGREGKEGKHQLPGAHLSLECPDPTDTRAMVALALSCVYDYVELQDVRELLREALQTVSTSFLDEQEKRDGMIGNIYSMGLALQVGEVPGECGVAPMAIAQVLPALVGRSYLDDMSPSRQLSLSPKLGTHGVPRGTLIPPGVPTLLLSPCTASIQVHYSITNTLQGKHFHYSTTVTVPSGSTLLQVMKVAAEENPQTFSFQTEQTSWGPYVTSIHGLAGSMDDRTYWQFLSAGNALEEGGSTTRHPVRQGVGSSPIKWWLHPPAVTDVIQLEQCSCTRCSFPPEVQW
uniref:DUF4430 domain-containing protein n=1 Tax=Catharus ustulatus TaxID=91951 RepID=A0A8C3V072_CATUS